MQIIVYKLDQVVYTKRKKRNTVSHSEIVAVLPMGARLHGKGDGNGSDEGKPQVQRGIDQGQR